MKAISLLLLGLVSCTSVGEMIERTNATAHIQPPERERVFAKALQVLQRNGWIVEKPDSAAGAITTQTQETGVLECGSTICNSRGTVNVAISEAGDVTVMLHREFYIPPPGPGWFTPGLDKDVHTIENEQQKILRAILEP
jgi:hypothetical protein